MNILFVCTGNTCRSPMAEGYLKSLHLSDINVLSAGIYADGEPVSDNSRDAMYDIGIDISSHISRPLTKEMLEQADRIYCMTASHKALLISLGTEKDKVMLLRENGISDPFGSDMTCYRNCRNEITDAIDSIFHITPKEVTYLSQIDAESVAEIEKACFSQPWSKASIEESMNGNNTFIGVKIENRLIGYVSVYESQGEGYINNVAVLPEFRRQGIAKALLCELNHYALNAHFDFLSLEVRESNMAAISLYTAFGFKCEGRRKNYYSSPTEDAIILTRRF